MGTDLSTRHEPVGKLLDSATGDLSTLRLTDEQVHMFHDGG